MTISKTQDSFPDVFRLEVAGNCNFHCKHCPTGRQANNRGILKPSAFKRILEQFAELDFVPRVVVLYHGGEPLINKHLEQYIATFKALGVSKTVITTNASLLTAKRAEGLVAAGLDEIKISFDGASAAENDLIRIGGDFRRDASNVKTLLRIRELLEKTTPSVRISNVRIANIAELTDLLKEGQEFFSKPPNYLIEAFGVENISFQSLPAMQWPGMVDEGSGSFVAPLQNKVNYCASLFETFSVLTNGNVVACCNDLIEARIFGNVFKNSIFEIWHSDEFAEFRRQFRANIYSEPCSSCVVISPRFQVASE